MPEAVPALDPQAAESSVVVRHLAHELRQPLSTIESIAFYLQMTLPESAARLRPQLDKLSEMVDLANWILADAVHYLQSAPASPELVDVDEILTGEVSESEIDGAEWCATRIGSGAALVRIDPGQAQHLMRNVLAIARRMLRAPAKATVATRVERECWLLEVAIPGATYNCEQLSGLFDPFGPHLPAGAGLALASARRIVETHGGTVEAVCRQQEGAALVVRLPLARG